ncbi:MAG: PstS family phosphate ABC transporter substrate-binding protein [Acidimicrobiales bacterium]
MTKSKSFGILTSVVAAGILVMSSCTSGEATSIDPSLRLSGAIRLDGSRTVAPLMKRATADFVEIHEAVDVTVATSGTGGGFEKFCAGEIDIADASRPIQDAEARACSAHGIEYTRFLVANDALAIVVNVDNDWLACVTVEQLRKIWEPASKVTKWSQVDPGWDDEPVVLFGPGTESGTFDYFTSVINGEDGASRTDYAATEDDNVTVRGVEGARGGLGYFGFSYYEENASNLKALEVDGGDGCVPPSARTVQDGSYAPLARPLFIYVANAALARPEVKAFVDFYERNADKVAEEALFVPLTDEQKADVRKQLETLG